MNVSDRVKVHAEVTSEFVIVSIDGEDAVIESVHDDVPGGRFPFMPAWSGWFRANPELDTKMPSELGG
ncbi:hypothetical protein [Rhodococcus sp. USK13]|uniref:hypothetical protein n=1 Tax=Rhodococcus sp. USK13 TaxID=2806442 RepID=UPI001BCAC342|nr:hypothetical protein [Rhodococcus sp. USK13]